MCQESCCSNEGQTLLCYLLKRWLVNQMPVVFWIPTANVWKISGPQEGSFSFIMLLCWLLWGRWICLSFDNMVCGFCLSKYTSLDWINYLLVACIPSLWPLVSLLLFRSTREPTTSSTKNSQRWLSLSWKKWPAGSRSDSPRWRHNSLKAPRNMPWPAHQGKALFQGTCSPFSSPSDITITTLFGLGNNLGNRVASFSVFLKTFGPYPLDYSVQYIQLFCVALSQQKWSVFPYKTSSGMCSGWWGYHLNYTSLKFP